VTINNMFDANVSPENWLLRSNDASALRRSGGWRKHWSSNQGSASTSGAGNAQFWMKHPPKLPADADAVDAQINRDDASDDFSQENCVQASVMAADGAPHDPPPALRFPRFSQL
jgi:hypothetical protein